MIFLFALVLTAQAQTLDLQPHTGFDAPPPPNKVDLNKPITTHETTVTVNGIQYRVVEYKGERFMYKGTQYDPYSDCSRLNLVPDSFAAQGAVKVTKRTALFIETLRQRCDENDHTVRTSTDLRDANIGVKWKTEGPNPKEKAILVNPFTKMGSFRTDF